MFFDLNFLIFNRFKIMFLPLYTKTVRFFFFKYKNTLYKKLNQTMIYNFL